MFADSDGCRCYDETTARCPIHTGSQAGAGLLKAASFPVDEGVAVKPKKSTRVAVEFRYDCLNWDFIKCLARVASYATEKYGSAEQYVEPRLTGDKGPMNHIAEHYRQYITGEPHDHFGDSRYHLVAIAYNAMMEFLYHTRFGQIISKLSEVGNDT